MDTTPKYIKMCNCSEMQDIIPRIIGDDGRKYIDGTAHVLKYHIGAGKLIWLPRQDQLQAIVETEYHQPMLAQVFYEFIEPEFFCHHMDEEDENGFACPVCSKLGRERRGAFNSFEQWWLAFVMQEKFNKVWDDKKEEWKTFAK